MFLTSKLPSLPFFLKINLFKNWCKMLTAAWSSASWGTGGAKCAVQGRHLWLISPPGMQLRTPVVTCGGGVLGLEEDDRAQRPFSP